MFYSIILNSFFSSLDLFLDARNTGEWTRCVKAENLDLPPGWVQHAHIGLTASTGQLADNHDVISLSTYSEPYNMEQDQLKTFKKKYYEVDPGATSEERLKK
jgi:mannose-binding lectin 2